MTEVMIYMTLFEGLCGAGGYSSHSPICVWGFTLRLPCKIDFFGVSFLNVLVHITNEP